MREIIFRGKREIDKRWIEGNFITDEQDKSKAYIGYLFGVDDDGTVHDTDISEVIPETICQCTGLTDKNGRKIFEGDIVKTKFFGKDNGKGQNFADYDIFKVVYKDGIYLLESAQRQFSAQYIPDMVGSGAPEVIGNIFDNPELIGDQP